MDYEQCILNIDYTENMPSMQIEGNVEGKCNIDRPFSKVLKQRVMAEHGLCM